MSNITESLRLAIRKALQMKAKKTNVAKERHQAPEYPHPGGKNKYSQAETRVKKSVKEENSIYEHIDSYFNELLESMPAEKAVDAMVADPDIGYALTESYLELLAEYEDSNERAANIGQVNAKAKLRQKILNASLLS